MNLNVLQVITSMGTIVGPYAVFGPEPSEELVIRYAPKRAWRKVGDWCWTDADGFMAMLIKMPLIETSQ